MGSVAFSDYAEIVLQHMPIREKISLWDIIGVIADVQTGFTEKFKKLQKDNAWTLPDARLQVMFNCLELAANARLSIAILASAKSNGLSSKDWWEKWAGYSPLSFDNIPNFTLYVEDKSRQYVHRVQEQLQTTTQIYTESFLRNLARQFNITEVEFWRLKKSLLEDTLGFNQDDLKSIIVFQHLKNSLHNKGLHYNEKRPTLSFEINGLIFDFTHGQPVMISWDHIKELLLANGEFLLQVIENLKVRRLLSFNERNVIILTDE